MGLLIGEIEELAGMKICCISAVIVLRRSDKQPDRVEISPEQLSDASTQAEQLAYELKRPMRVIGWYHSHPRITVWPSHVDVQTQAMYQMMDERFIGLIFSVFNQEKNTKQNRIQVTCFQSINQSPEGEPPQLMRLEIPLHITPVDSISRPCMEALVSLPRILSQEEAESYQQASNATDMDLLSQVHNGAVFTKSLCHIMEVMSGPFLQTLENRLQQNRREISQLTALKQQLTEQLKAKKASDSVQLQGTTHKSTTI